MDRSLKTNVLLIEDDPNLSEKITDILVNHNYRVNAINNGMEAIEKALVYMPDLVLLDWLLPGKSGLEVCREMKRTSKIADVPIIMISSRDKDFEKVVGLESGIDDYVTKPFSAPELIARIKALLRRVSNTTINKTLKYAGIEVDQKSHTVYCNKKQLKLSPIEFQILHVLIQTPEIVVKRDVLIKKIWGMNQGIEARTLDVHITRLRKGLTDKGSTEFIKTIRSVGYKLKVDK